MSNNSDTEPAMYAVEATFWIDRDPQDLDLTDIAVEAKFGDGLIVHRRDTYLPYPQLDANFVPEAAEFFLVEEGSTPTRQEACAEYARELLDIHNRIASLRERYGARVGYRALIADLTALTHLESVLEDSGHLAKLPEVFRDLVSSGAQPCVSGGDDHLWEWEQEEISKWLTRQHPDYITNNSEDENDDNNE